MERWLAFLQKWFFWRSQPENRFCESLNLDEFLKKVMDALMEETGAGQVVWIESSEAKHLANHLAGAKYEHAPGLTLGGLVKTTKDISFDNLVDLLRPFDLNLGVVQVRDSSVFLPVTHFSSRDILGYILLSELRPPQASAAAKAASRLMTGLSKHLGFCLEHQAALGASYLDDLTGLHNQKYMSMVLENEVHRSSRQKQKFSVLFMDIDFFKSVNDNQGHWVGSRLLVELARVIKAHTRRSDYCFRYGGDEFVVVLPETSAEGAVVAGERIRKVVEGMDFVIDGLQLNLTLSIGIATYPDHALSHKEIIQMADQAMYCGKNKSRNIVFMAS